MSVWLALKESEGWRELEKIYEGSLAYLRAELMAQGLKSSDPEVRAIAWQMHALHDVLGRPDAEIDIAKERLEREAEDEEE